MAPFSKPYYSRKGCDVELIFSLTVNVRGITRLSSISHQRMETKNFIELDFDIVFIPFGLYPPARYYHPGRTDRINEKR